MKGARPLMVERVFQKKREVYLGAMNGNGSDMVFINLKSVDDVDLETLCDEFLLYGSIEAF